MGEDPKSAGEPAIGWTLERLTPRSDVPVSNGLQFGPDGGLYVAQLLASRISRVDVDTGVVDRVLGSDSGLVGPDDLDFDDRGTMYIADNMGGRVWRHDPDGQSTVIADDVPAVNGITCYRGRVFVNECRPTGRLMELVPGQAPTMLSEGLVTPNAMAVGPDGLLYYPLVMPGEIWRLPLDGGTAELVASDLNLPSALKFDRNDVLTVVSAVTGEISSIDLAGGARSLRATGHIGIDNLAFSSDNRLFVSNWVRGGVTEVRDDGSLSEIVAGGFNGPYGLAAESAGVAYLADGASLATVSTEGTVHRVATLLDHGFPGVIRGLALGPAGLLHSTTTDGSVITYDPSAQTSVVLATGLNELAGIAVDARGASLVAETGGGRVLKIDTTGSLSVLADGLDRPMAVAVSDDGVAWITEAGTGRVLRLADGQASIFAESLQTPHGIAVRDDQLFVLDIGSKQLVRYTIGSGARSVVASELVVGSPAGAVQPILPGVEIMPGPLTRFADICATADGAVMISADGEGSVVMVRQS